MSTMRQNIFEVPEMLKKIRADAPRIREIFNDISKSKRVIFAGSGSSYHVAQYGVRLLEEKGFHAIAKTSADFDTFDLKPTDAVILVSVSGTKGDALRIFNKAKAAGSKLWVITSNPEVDAEHVYVVPTGVKSSYINTHAYIGQLAALYHIFHDDDLSEDAERALAQESTVKSVAKRFADRKNFVFLSAGYGMVSAHQSAHKFREVLTHIKHVEAQGYDELLHAALPALYKGDTAFISLEYETDHTDRRDNTKIVLEHLGSDVECFKLDVNKYKAPIIMQIIPYILTEEIAKMNGMNPDEPPDIDIIKKLVYENKEPGYEKTNKSEKI